MARWKQHRAITGTPPPPAAPGVDTGALIDAVLTGRPTDGGPRHLAAHVPDRRVESTQGVDGSLDLPGPSARSAGFASKAGAAAATTAGKIVLCAAVAAASVGGVYATAAVDRPWPSESPALQSASTLPTSSSTTSSTTSTVPASPAAMPEPVPAAVVEEQPVAAVASATPVPEVDPVTSTVVDGPTGCEYGQATAAESSRADSGDREEPARDHDPCDASEAARGPGHSGDADEPRPPSQHAGEGGGGDSHTETNGGGGGSGGPTPPGRGGRD